MDEITRVKAEIEAALFVYGEPVKLSVLADLLEIDRDIILKAMEELKNDLEKEKRGLRIRQIEDSFQLHTAIEMFYIINKIKRFETNSELSKANLEVLTIIAYNQPITRFEIEEIRGVRSFRAIDNLLKQKLIVEIKPSEDNLLEPSYYKTSRLFLEKLNIKDLSELPTLRKEE